MPGTEATPAPQDLGEPPDVRRLPEPIALEDTVAAQDVHPVPDPQGGRDANHEWMLRHG